MKKLLDVNINEAGYGLDNNIIKNINFSIHTGEIVGLIGPNGAGKSTSIKSILGLLEDFQGEIDFIKDYTYAYIPERPVFYDELTLWEHLDLAASVMSIGDQEFKDRASRLLQIFNMSKVVHKLPSTFSKGMQQKVMLITAFLLKPDIYIIDEPFVGLDPMAMKDFLLILNEEKERGAGILMSTHVLDTAEKVCDRFLLVSEGQLKADGTLEAIQSQANMQGESLFTCFHTILAGERHERV